jgi:signal peptidase I
VLFVIMLISGAVWLIDALFLRRGRQLAATAPGAAADELPEPGTVDYARSFFPVAAILLVLRAFVFEPYRIPTDSMMPTLLAGDFIVVNKFAYGLRLPVTQRKVVDTGLPQRGDIVVFRYPPNPKVNYIKRLVGLPGDLVQVQSDQLIINGLRVPLSDTDRYSDGCYLNMRLATEQLGEHRHQVLHCVSPDYIQVAPLPGCNREIQQNYVCNESSAPALADLNDAEIRVPAGKYLMIGDNRDNSADGRVWGFVDETQLVGKATRIWFNWDSHRTGGPMWNRIGSKIE